jgi:hypothetical protein
MIKIKKEFRRSVFTHKQLMRTKSKALFGVFYKGKLLCHEIIKVVSYPYPFRKNETYEKYPKEEDFGEDAWSYQDYGMAIACYRGLR